MPATSPWPHAVLALIFGLAGLAAMAQPLARTLPAEVDAALARAQVPPEALVAFVQELGAPKPLLAWRPDEPANPASLTKLLTTFAGLELLGPAWSWTTPVWLRGPVNEGVLDGDLVIRGSGDPTLVQERLWLLLRRVQQLGVREIHGDIVLDRSAFTLPDQGPGEFDGEPRRPYNVRPDALMLNFKASTLTFTPDLARGVAQVGADPSLPGAQVDANLPLSAGPCDDWRSVVRLDLGDPRNTRFDGSFPAACGERQWPIADAEPASYNARLLATLWRELGGTLSGSVHDGPAPATPASFAVSSPALAEVVRDINKFSNNVMAQQLFLTLGLARRDSGTPQAARMVLRQWLAERMGRSAEGMVLDNGSGLSRDTRLSARQLARLLQLAWDSPVMPELMASLPLAGVDGTLRNSRASLGRAHLKTGSLRDVAGLAGYVLADSGRRYALVAIVNHARAAEARPALDALVQWVAETPAKGRR